MSLDPSFPVPPIDLANSKPPEKLSLIKNRSVSPLEIKFVVVLLGLKSAVSSKVPVTNKNPKGSIAKEVGESFPVPPMA